MGVEDYQDPSPHERVLYEGAVKGRNAEAYLQLFRDHPFVMWGSVSRTMTEEDRQWTQQVLKGDRKQTEPNF